MKQYELVCPRCRKQFIHTLPEAADGAKDAAVKEKIFSGDFFTAACPHCGSVSAVLLPFLYHDSEKHFMVQLIDETEQDPFANALGILQEEDEIREHAVKNNWQMRIVRHPNELLEKILLFEEGKDDRAVELLKQMILPVLKEQTGTQARGLLWSPSGDGAVFVVETDEGFVGEIPFDAKQYDHVVKKVIPELDEALLRSHRIDPGWAGLVLSSLDNT